MIFYVSISDGFDLRVCGLCCGHAVFTVLRMVFFAECIDLDSWRGECVTSE